MNKLNVIVAALALCMSGAAFAGVKEETTESCSKETYTPSCNNNVGKFCSTSKVEGAAEGATTVWTLTCGANETCTNTDGSIDCRVGEGCVSAESYCDENDPKLGHRCKDGAFIDWNCSRAGEVCQVGIKEDGTPSPGWLSCIAGDDGGGSTGGCTNADSYCDENDPKLGHRCKDGVFIDWNCSKAGEICQVGIKEDGTPSPGWLSCIAGDDGGGSTGGCTNADSYCDATDPKLGHRCKDGAFIDWNCSKAGEICQAGFKEDGTPAAGWLLCVAGDDTAPPTPGPSTCTEANYCSADGKISYNCANGSLVPTPCIGDKSCKMDGSTATCVASIGDGNGGNKDEGKKDDTGCSATGAGFLAGWLGLALLPALRRRQR
ncbi:MAG: hypothetical protein LBM75_01550 [Myxococcales bacterium]|jgi:uncharacterized protein (TIGR03382 family)|nr:hypothetical protein [Myxococcales bacterium]